MESSQLYLKFILIHPTTYSVIFHPQTWVISSYAFTDLHLARDTNVFSYKSAVFSFYNIFTSEFSPADSILAFLKCNLKHRKIASPFWIPPLSTDWKLFAGSKLEQLCNSFSSPLGIPVCTVYYPLS